MSCGGLSLKLWLVRHAASTRDKQGRHEAHEVAQERLTQEGVAQAEALARHLGDNADGAAIYTSHLPRARATADIICRALGGDVVEDPRLAERATGLSLDATVAEEKAAIEEGFLTPYEAPQGGESVSEHRGRVLHWFEDWVRTGNRQAVVVCHEGSIEHLFGILSGVSLLGMAAIYPTCDVGRMHIWTRIKLGGDQGRALWRLDGANLPPGC